MHAHTPETRDQLTPALALEVLREGNSRFRENLRATRNLLQQVNETAGGQSPFAVVLSCIDSRTSAELIFDQGLGDVFSVRIAGNFLNGDILGSMEFACHVAGAKLVVVLGHSACGAIKGACDKVELGLLTKMLANIQPAIDAVSTTSNATDRSSQNAEFVEAVAEKNVRLAIKGITNQSDVLRKMVEDRSIDIVGGMYDVSTGAVTFLDE
jgi:carbonic anhydrase